MLRQFSKPKFQVKNSIRWVSWSVSVAVAIGLLVNFSGEVGRSQPPLTAEQQATLEEAKQLSQQVNRLYKEGKYSAAISLAERLLLITEKAFGKEHFLFASSLYTLALLYHQQGSYQKAEPLYLRSLAIYEKVLGKEHQFVADNLNDLAEVYREQGSYQKAEPLYLRSLAIREKVLGIDHPDVGQSLNNLALLYRGQGNYQKAEPLYLRSLAIREKALGTDHPVVADSLNNLAALYQNQGSDQKAESLYLRSLAIREKVLIKDHPVIAQSLNNLALLYLGQGSYQKAEPLFQRSLVIREKALGTDHPLFANSLSSLALLYHKQRNYQKAEPLYLRSLFIREKALGKDHPDVTIDIHNLALLYQAQGSYQKAEPLFQRSLFITEKALGKEHPNVAQSLNSLADLYWAQGDITRTFDFLNRGLAVEESNLSLQIVVGSEQRKQDYAQTFFRSTYRVISLFLHKAASNPTVGRLALTTLLRRKGLVLDAVTDNIQTLRSQLANKPATQKLFDEWLDVQQQLSTLIFKGLGTQTPQAYQTRIQQLQAEKERLEDAISSVSAEFRNQTQSVELNAIQAKIPKDAALVEIVQYRPFDASAKPNQQWGNPRYAAAIVRSSGEPKWIDLGEASAINKSIVSLRSALAGEPATRNQQNDRSIIVNPVEGIPKKAIQSVQQLARTLDKQVMAPIRPLLGDATHILISPDGQLTLIPFEALQDEQGKYLIQRYAFSYLTSGRDLMRFQSGANSNSTPVVFADINYDQQQIADAPKSTDTSRGYENRRSTDLASNIRFGKLTNTREEAQQIKAIFPETTIVSDEQATETAIKQLSAPSILHLATHGFFLPDQPQKLIPNLLDLQQPKVLLVENPLLRSGVALAGFNDRHLASSDTNDGVLTSLEVAGLNLRGTQLVVLSACETGLGDVKVGDGIYGLRRVLTIAGSQSQVLSLWKVDDAGTKDLMVKYYQKLKAGKGRHEALREAQLEMLILPKYEHPFFWASFVPSGDWTPLSLK